MLIGRVEETAELEALLDQVRDGHERCPGPPGRGRHRKDGPPQCHRRFGPGPFGDPNRGHRIRDAAGLCGTAPPSASPTSPGWITSPSPNATPLQSAFGLTSLAPADRFLVSLAALSLLGDVAQEDPLLIVVDDAQWLDRESVAALVFVARRLHADRIALVFAARDSLEIGATFQGIPELWVSGLDDDFARDLLTRLGLAPREPPGRRTDHRGHPGKSPGPHGAEWRADSPNTSWITLLCPTPCPSVT